MPDYDKPNVAQKINSSCNFFAVNLNRKFDTPGDISLAFEYHLTKKGVGNFHLYG